MRMIEQQPAWLLHSRPFRDTSLLLDFLTLEHGRVSAIARGARNAKSRSRALLQPFQPLLISLVGRSELQTLKQVESGGAAQLLRGERLFAALYINELMVRLLRGHDSEISLFEHYGKTLAALGGEAELEPLLRGFELRLLDILGYGLQFDVEADSGNAIAEEHWYYLHHDSGFVRQLQVQDSQSQSAAHNLYPGSALLAIGGEDFSAETTRRFAKRLLREVLQLHLADRPLASRELFKGTN